MALKRKSRKNNELRSVFLGPGFCKNAHGSCFVKYGDTHVLCTATIEEKIPPFLRGTGSGWIHAEYGMLPCSGNERIEREAVKGKQSGRTQEIQRLIARSLRCVVDLKALGERQIKIDCDVLQADGGTRTASITGAYVALRQAINGHKKIQSLSSSLIVDQVAAVSCGIVDGEPCLDLDYLEDSNAQVDANFILTAKGQIVEIQTTAEKESYSFEDFFKLLELAKQGCHILIEKQKEAIATFPKF
jgi:ribonuclease PH